VAGTLQSLTNYGCIRTYLAKKRYGSCVSLLKTTPPDALMYADDMMLTADSMKLFAESVKAMRIPKPPSQ